MNYIGIDVSKKTFDMAIGTGSGYSYHTFSNDQKGFHQLDKMLDKQEHWCVMEASGPYYLKLATYLQKRGISVSVVNPLVIRRFCQMRLARVKTDRKKCVYDS